ncbi:MAG: diguanylate cyclase [Xanthomonadaceae bacterium]|jgi:diguanylate cyclase (GGDEF)-like protein/PAS domain S-box-containing protein|nr:diguanylate cyclase [Xanthomonadaceae bacterium]
MEQGQINQGSCTPQEQVPPTVLAMVLKYAVDAMLIVDMQGKIRFCNAASERLWEKSATELLGTRFEALWSTPSSQVEGAAEIGRPPASALPDWPLECLRLAADGDDRRLALSCSPVDVCGTTWHLLRARDVTQERRREQERSYLAIATDAEELAIIVIDENGRIDYVNSACTELCGCVDEALLGRSVIRLLMRTDANRNAWRRLREHGDPQQALHEELLIRGRRGRGIWISARLRLIVDRNGRVERWVVRLAELADRGRLRALQSDALEWSLKERPLNEILNLVCWRFDGIVSNGAASVLLVNEDGSVRAHIGPGLPELYLKAMEGTTVRSSASGCGMAVYRGLPQQVDDIALAPEWAPYRDMLLPFELHGCWALPIVLLDGRIAGAFCFHFPHACAPSAWREHLINVCVDLCAMVIGRDQSRKRVVRPVYRNMTAYACERVELWRRIEQAIVTASIESGPLAFVLMDIDGFRHANEQLGHEAGNRLLDKIVERLQQQLRPSDIVGRLDEDEFVVVLPDCDAACSNNIVKRLTHALKMPFSIDDKQLLLSASIGVSLYPGDGLDSDTLLKYADKAMYEVKRQGGGSYRFSSLLS